MEERGIPLPNDEVAVVIAALEDWIKNTNQGKEYVVSLFGFDWTHGSSEHNYEIQDRYGRPTEVLKADQIYFLQAAVAKGDFLPMSQINAVPLSKTGCDKCGILSHCTRKLTENSKEVSVCNHCLQFVENPDHRSLGGGLRECEGCSAMGCEYHPSVNRRRFA